MKRKIIGVVALLALTACHEARSPTAPDTTVTPPPASTNASFTGNIMDIDTHRMCIEHAQAEIIAGPSAGTVYPQNFLYCEDPGSGFVINGSVGQVLNLRISAPGYISVEREFVMQRPSFSIDINLKRAA